MSAMQPEVEFVRRTDAMPWDRADEGGHSVRLALIGAKGAVSFLYVPDLPLWEELNRILTGAGLPPNEYPMGIDVSYHSPVPLRDFHVTQDEYEARRAVKVDEFLSPDHECELLREGRCYTDGSAAQGSTVGDLFRAKGEDAVWEYLAFYYHATFYGLYSENDEIITEFGDLMKMLAEIFHE